MQQDPCRLNRNKMVPIVMVICNSSKMLKTCFWLNSRPSVSKRCKLRPSRPSPSFCIPSAKPFLRSRPSKLLSNSKIMRRMVNNQNYSSNRWRQLQPQRKNYHRKIEIGRVVARQSCRNHPIGNSRKPLNKSANRPNRWRLSSTSWLLRTWSGLK